MKWIQCKICHEYVKAKSKAKKYCAECQSEKARNYAHQHRKSEHGRELRNKWKNDNIERSSKDYVDFMLNSLEYYERKADAHNELEDLYDKNL